MLPPDSDTDLRPFQRSSSTATQCLSNPVARSKSFAEANSKKRPPTLPVLSPTNAVVLPPIDDVAKRLHHLGLASPLPADGPPFPCTATAAEEPTPSPTTTSAAADPSASALTPRRRPNSVVAHFPPELLIQIFAHFDPPSSSATAYLCLSPKSTTAALAACSGVSKWWSRVVTKMLWRRPRVYDVMRFEKMIEVAERSDGTGASGGAVVRGIRHRNEAAEESSGGKNDTPSDSDLPTENDTGATPSSQTLFQYSTLLEHLSLSQTLPETHRHSPRLSTLLTRLLTLPTLHLSVLDLGFCKISNFDLQRSAHALSTLKALNLSGGGRSEICVIKLARECRSLQRLCLGWNEAVGDFAVREVGRLCASLVWLDLSGCWRVGDAGVGGLARTASKRASRAPLPVPRLRYLNLSYCTNLTIAGVHELLQNCGESLEVLNVFGCGDVARLRWDGGETARLKVNVPG
ncbi:hypothetical protein BDK51DRAFT_32360, partial [Blyttiomyces helicus]